MTTTSPGLHLAAEDAADGLLLRFVDAGAPAEDKQRRVDAGRLDDAAPAGDVARQYGQPAVAEIGVFQSRMQPAVRSVSGVS